MREYYLRARNFTRKVLGLRAIGVSFARPLPTTRPGLDHDLMKLGPVAPDARRARIAARVRPAAEVLATNFGLQKIAFDSTFTETPVEVASNLGNAVEALSHWLCNAMDAKPLVARGRETEAHWMWPRRRTRTCSRTTSTGASTPVCSTARWRTRARETGGRPT